MPYASIPDVRGKVSIRTIDGTSDPSVQEVVGYLTQIAADIDVALAANGYAVPVATTATSAFAFLGLCNAYGAAMLTESASAKGKESPHLEFLERQYNMRLTQIQKGEITLPGVDPSVDTAAPRANGIATSMFSIYDER